MNNFSLAVLNGEDREGHYISTFSLRQDELNVKGNDMTDDEYDELVQIEEIQAEMFNDTTTRISDMINIPFELTDVMFTPSNVVDETGNTIQAIRTIVRAKIDGNFQTFATNSKVFAEKTVAILNIMGNPRTWRRPRKFVVKQIEVKKGRSFTIIPYREN